jgi:hypothetical protein
MTPAVRHPTGVTRAVVALGANLGDRGAALSSAIARLEAETTVIAMSDAFETSWSTELPQRDRDSRDRAAPERAARARAGDRSGCRPGS